MANSKVAYFLSNEPHMLIDEIPPLNLAGRSYWLPSAGSEPFDLVEDRSCLCIRWKRDFLGNRGRRFWWTTAKTFWKVNVYDPLNATHRASDGKERKAADREALLREIERLQRENEKLRSHHQPAPPCRKVRTGNAKCGHNFAQFSWMPQVIDTAWDTCLAAYFILALSGEWMENEAGVFMSTIPKEVARAAAARVLG